MDEYYYSDLSMLPKELRLLLEIMTMEDDESIKTDKNELFSDIDWEGFLELARHHRIYPIIYTKIKKRALKGIPPQVIQTLYQEYKKNTIRMLLLSGEMEQVSILFSKHQIRLLFLKGPVIAADIYGDISLRTSKDLDILISINDLKKAEELLLNNGYEREDDSATFVEWKWRKHHITFFHPQKGIQIEIHWRLHPPPTKEPNFNELWERKRISNLTTYPVYLLGEEDLFLFLVDHGNRHGWFRLRWLVDIDQIIRKRIISENNYLLLKNNHQCNALLLTSQLFKTPINKEIQSLITLKRNSRQLHLAIFYIIEMGKSYITQYHDNLTTHHSVSLKLNIKKLFLTNYYLFSMMSDVQKFLFVIKLFYPSDTDVQILRLPKPLRFLYFPLKPFLWVWKKTRKPF
ncbi:Renal dipeptidase [Bacillus sp. AFS043905]|nr:Renal dipeptidase [Bacillus sp. AFS043905]